MNCIVYNIYLLSLGWHAKKMQPQTREHVIQSRRIITTSAEVTLNGGLVRESPPNPLNSGLGIIVICPDSITTLPAENLFLNPPSDWLRSGLMR